MKLLKNILKNIWIFLGLFVLLGLANIWYVGGFSKIEVKEQNMWPYTIAYTQFTGAYAKVWPSMTMVYDVLSGAGVTSSTGIGIYYDDPALVSWTELRSDVGAVIDLRDITKLNKKSAIKLTTLSEKPSIVVEFPLKNNVSYMIGPMKVYPAIAKYMTEKGYTTWGAMIEIYDIAAKKIYYITSIK